MLLRVTCTTGMYCCDVEIVIRTAKSRRKTIKTNYIYNMLYASLFFVSIHKHITYIYIYKCTINTATLMCWSDFYCWYFCSTVFFTRDFSILIDSDENCFPKKKTFQPFLYFICYFSVYVLFPVHPQYYIYSSTQFEFKQ